MLAARSLYIRHITFAMSYFLFDVEFVIVAELTAFCLLELACVSVNFRGKTFCKRRNKGLSECTCTCDVFRAPAGLQRERLGRFHRFSMYVLSAIIVFAAHALRSVFGWILFIVCHHNFN